MDRARAAPSAKPTKSGFIGLEASGPFTYPRGLQAPDDFDSSSVPGASADKGPSGPVGGADKERNHRPGGIWVPDGQPLPPGAELSSGTTLGLHAQRQGAVRTNLQRPPSSTRAAFRRSISQHDDQERWPTPARHPLLPSQFARARNRHHDLSMVELRVIDRRVVAIRSHEGGCQAADRACRGYRRLSTLCRI